MERVLHMITVLLIKKIVSLFLMMFVGWLLVRFRLLKSEDSRVLSVLVIYVILPCVIISAYQVDYTPEIRNGLLLSLGAAVLINAALILLNMVIRKPLKLDAVDQASVIYSNSANLIVPIVTSVLGPEWVIYSSVFVAVQLIPLFSHGKCLMSGDRHPDIRKILTNVNMISIFVGVLMFVLKIHLPSVVASTVDSLSATVGPLAMIITGMLIGGIDLKAYLRSRHLWLVVFLRLIGMPLLILAGIKLSGAAALNENGFNILLISFLATIAPPASTLTQMAQVYHGDANYASALAVISTLCCIVTMPAMVYLYTLL